MASAILWDMIFSSPDSPHNLNVTSLGSDSVASNPLDSSASDAIIIYFALLPSERSSVSGQPDVEYARLRHWS